MYNTIAHHLLTNAQFIPEQLLSPLSQLPPIYVLGMMFYGTENPFGCFKPAVLASCVPA